MRTRLVIPAALLVAAAYIKGRQDAHDLERPMSPPACELSDEIRRRAEAEAADAMEILGERPVAVPAAPVAHRPSGDLAGVVRALVPDERVPSAPSAQDVAERVVARAAAEVAAVASPPAPRPAGVFDAWVVPEFPAAPRPRRPRAAAAPAAPPAEPRPVATPAPVAEPAGPDLAIVSEWSAPPPPVAQTAPSPEAAAPAAVPDEPAGVLSEWAANVAAGPLPCPTEGGGAEAEAEAGADARIEVEIHESGRFSLGGWAAQAGQMAFCGVTFRDRRTGRVPAGDIRLVPDATVNVADDGLIVLGDAGFAPDRDGFTLLVAAAGPGAFAANGRYEVVAA